MKYDLVQILKDSFPIIGENEIANELIGYYIAPFNNSTYSISADCINIEKDSNGNKHYIDVIDDNTVHISKININETEHYSFKIENETNFIASYFYYTIRDKYHILQSYQFHFKNTDILLAKGGEWYYDINNYDIIGPIKLTDNTNYFDLTNNLVNNHYEEYRVVPDAYHTLIIDNTFGMVKKNINGAITKNASFEDIDAFKEFEKFVVCDIIFDEEIKKQYALLNNFLGLKFKIERIKTNKKNNENNRQYIKLFDIKNKRDDN